MSAVRTIVFAKLPRAGYAKTRLIPLLGPQGAATLAKQMLRHTLHQALEANIGPVELCVTHAADHAAWQGIDGIPAEVLWSSQGPGELGERLARAARRCLKSESAVLLIGTDCPQLDAYHLQQAARSLSSHDASIIPATDGGYVLLGLRRFYPTMFENISWSTSMVARQTLVRLQQIGCSVKKMEALQDIDEVDDLQWLPKEWGNY